MSCTPSGYLDSPQDTINLGICEIQNFEFEFNRGIPVERQYTLTEVRTIFFQVCMGLAVAFQKNDENFIAHIICLEEPKTKDTMAASCIIEDFSVKINFVIRVSPLLFTVTSIHLR